MAEPIEMPSPLPVKSKRFDLLFAESVSPSGSQHSQTIERSEPMWSAQYQTPPLRDERDQKFQAFLDALRGSSGQFLAFDPRRTRPYAYRSIPGEPWRDVAGTPPSCISGSRANGTLELGRLAVGAILTPTDMLSFKIGPAWYLFRLITGGVVDGTKRITVQVTPRPPTFTGQLYDVRMVKACAAMKIQGGIQTSDSVDSFPTYSFSAIQFRAKA